MKRTLEFLTLAGILFVTFHAVLMGSDFPTAKLTGDLTMVFYCLKMMFCGGVFAFITGTARKFSI